MDYNQKRNVIACPPFTSNSKDKLFMKGLGLLVTLLISYIILGLSIAAPIGPINIEIIKKGLSYGFWPALCVGLGGMSSDLVLMVLMFLGVSYFLAIWWVKMLLMIAGCFLLIQSGWSSLNAAEPYQQENRVGSSSSPILASYSRGFLIAGTNPMNLLFWISIYGSILSSSFEKTDMLHSFLMSTLVFIGIGLWNLNLAFTTHFSRSIAKPSFIKIINVCASLILIGFGLRFGYQGIALGISKLYLQ
ncbi:LysE family translocator [Halobacillus salinarum]|uniref:LysE family translocator n=1 Tax=Halobacillus salinarum TaxID=2932257 RepID=A0ABY4EMS5_9BACI|nr:LysE family transporter [Halobacillus salinarum]UOQ45153.1 LysE family translocator [Halobacillus salinarum]